MEGWKKRSEKRKRREEKRRWFQARGEKQRRGRDFKCGCGMWDCWTFADHGTPRRHTRGGGTEDHGPIMAG
jgi:hypothetical protein